jgi:hypothetical protein
LSPMSLLKTYAFGGSVEWNFWEKTS